MYNTANKFVEAPKSAAVLEYQHEHMEGPYIASFVLQAGEGDTTDADLLRWFDSYLMYQWSTMYNGTEVWRGYIWEMQLELNGEVAIKSMEDMANATKCRYTNADGDVIHTSWYTNTEAINRYGRKELVVTASTESGDEATERAQTELRYKSSPYTTPVAYRETTSNRIMVTAVGAMVAANNIVQVADSTLRDVVEDGTVLSEDDYLYQFQQTDYRDAVTVSFEIKRIIATVNYLGGWLYELDVEYNDTDTLASVAQNTGSFDRLYELSRLRNSDGDYFRLMVTNDGGVIYREFTETVDYLRYRAPRGLERPDGSKPTWGAKPGIIKRVDSSGGVPVPNTWLSDGRLSFAERVVMRDGDKVATFHGRELDPTDIYRAQEANRRWIERDREEPKKKQKEEEPAGHYDIYGHWIPDPKGLD